MNAGVEMPKYQSHKQVWALQIEKSTFNPNGSLDLMFVKSDVYAPINIEGDDAERIHKMMEKHPDDAGYYVVYPDGYKSWSPTQSFEDGYDLIEK